MRKSLTVRIFFKLILGVLIVLVVALTAVDYFASEVAQRTYVEALTRELADKARMLALVPEQDLQHGTNTLSSMAKAAAGRLTVVDADGNVIADSDADPKQMDNHASRPEIRQALNGNVGSATRASNTVGLDALYVAVPVRSGAVRIAVPLKEIDLQVTDVRKQLLTSVAVAFLPAIVIAAVFARYVSSKLANVIDFAGRLANGDFQTRLPQSTGRDELGVLSNQLNETGEKLQKMFEQLQHEQTELEKLERIRKDFVINVSHELRTPLASIQGYTETLLDGALHDPDHNIRFLQIIRQNAERLGRLTADLMTLSRLEFRTTRFQFASYRVNGLMEDCVDSMRPMADKKDVKMQVEEADAKLEVFCDFEAVHQIMGNLLDNALKYTPEHGTITVGASPAADTAFIQFFVRDTGIGIPADEQARLFERFYRVDKARSRALGGTGLGLAIVKHLVRAQGGDIGVSSSVGTGSTFWFSLPVHDLGLTEYGAMQPEMVPLPAIADA